MDKNKKLEEQINLLLKGYLIPIVGCVLIIVVIIFIYIPNVNGIYTGITTLPGLNDKYDSYKNQIQYYKNLSSTQNQINLTDNLLAANTVLPDESKTADSITLIQNIAVQDGITVTSVNSSAFDNKSLQNTVTLDPNLKIIQVSFHGSGTSAQIEKLFNDVNNMKQVASITDININGQLGSGSDDVTFNCQIYSLASSDIAKSLNLLSTVKTSYTTDYINTL